MTRFAQLYCLLFIGKFFAYYFDWFHYSLEGAREVGRIIADQLMPLLGK